MIPDWLQPVDHLVLWLLAPMVFAILISGLDDLMIDVAWMASCIASKLRPAASLFPPGKLQLESAPKRRIAILLPLWQEQDVIGRMLEHSLASIRYPDYHIFAGVSRTIPRRRPRCRLSPTGFRTSTWCAVRTMDQRRRPTA
jgi:hypothetical protein